MNAPPRFEFFILGENEKPLEIIEDTKIPNAATIKIWKQDHTIANMVRAQLLAMPGILFAGYKVPHPLEPYFILKVQTDGTKTPNEAVQHACSELIKTISSITEQFKRGFGRAEMDDSTDLRQGASMGIHQPWATSNNDYVDFQ